MSQAKRGRETTDEELSALIDGEIDAASEARARAEIASDPVLAERLKSFERVDSLLRGLPAREVSPQLEARALEREAAAGERPKHGGRRAAPVRRSRWHIAAPVAAVLAAGLALYLAAGPTSLTAPLPAEGREVARQAPSDAPGDTAAIESALEFGLAELDEEDLEIALDFETLSDFELIDQLDELELMVALEAEQG